MRIRTVKIIDEYAGRALTPIARRLPASTSSARPRRILFIKFWGLGSIVLASAAIRSIRAAFPDARIDMLTLAENRDVCSHLGLFDRVHTLSIERWDAFARTLARTALDLRRCRYDTVVDLELFAYASAFAAVATGAARRIGFSKGASRLMTSTVPFDPNRHVVESFRSLAVEVTGLPAQMRPSVQISPPDAARVAATLERFGIGRHDTVVAMNVNASRLAFERRWPRDRFAQIAARLSATFGAHIVLIGSCAERDYADGLLRELPHPTSIVNLAGRLAFGELVALLGRAALLVTNDSGPLHVASALDTPTVALFGPETPTRYGPLSSQRLVLYAGLACSPCMSVMNRKTVDCHYDALCMRSISVESAWSQIEPFVSRVLARARECGVGR